MSGAPEKRGNGGAVAKFIVSAVLFVLGIVGVLVVDFLGIGGPDSPGFIVRLYFSANATASIIITLVTLLAIVAFFTISAILLCSGFKSLSRSRKGIASAYGGGKVSSLIILGNIFIGLGFYVFMFISSLGEINVAILFGMNPFSNPLGLIKIICLVLFIVGILLLLLGVLLAIISYKKTKSAFDDDSYIPLSSYVTKPMGDSYDAAAGAYDPNAGYAQQPEDNYDSLPVGGQPDPVFAESQPQPVDFQNFEPANVPNYAQNDNSYNTPNNPMSDFEPQSISQFDSAPANNVPAQDAYNAGYNAAPAQDAYNAGYNAAPAPDAYNAGYNAPSMGAYNPAPAPADGSRLKSTFRAPRNPDGASSGSIPPSAMNQEYTKPHDRFTSAGDL